MTHSHIIIPISAYGSHYIQKENRWVPGAKPYETDFYTEMIRTRDGYYNDIIQQVRAIEDKEARNTFKAEKLPSVTISCTTHTWRKEDNIISHSGLLNIDVDGKDNPQFTCQEDWEKFRDDMGELDYVVAAWLSASGLGTTFVVKVEPDKEAHLRAFHSIREDLEKYRTIKLDKGTHDVTRLRFVSSDPNMVLKFNFDEIPVYYGRVTKKQKQDFNAIDFVPTTELDTEHNFRECMKHAEAKGYQFSDGQKHFYLARLAGKCNSLGMSQGFVEGLVLQTFSAFSGIPDEQLLQPVRNVYRTYQAQHGTYKPKMQVAVTADGEEVLVVTEEEDSPSKRLFIEACRCNYNGLPLKEMDFDLIGPQYEVAPDEARKIFERVYRENAEEHGMESKPEIVKVEHYLKKKYEFAQNEVTLQRSYRERGEKEWRSMAEEEIWRDLQIQGFKFDLNKVKALMKTSFVQVFNPFKDYFEKLPAWDPDKDPDHITALAGHVETDNQAFFLTQFKKCLVRSIACSLDGVVNRIVFTLVGEKQETGKSSFIRFLNPFGEEYYDESAIKDNKDSEFKFAENFIYNLEELAALSNMEINRLKAIISMAQIKQRKAYASTEVRQMRRCNFFASTNKSEFLTDSENTRWLCFNIRSINHDYCNQFTGVQNVDIDKVWAQAYYLYKQGIPVFDYRLTQEESETRAQMNKAYELNTPEKDLILMYIKPVHEDDKKNRHHFMNSTEILAHLTEQSNNRIKLSPVTLGRTLAQLGFPKGQQRINGSVVKGYYVEKVGFPGTTFYDADEKEKEKEAEETSIPYFGNMDFHKENPDNDLPF